MAFRYPDSPEVSEELQRWSNWFKACYNWTPLEPTVCFECKKSLEWVEVYRCYDCQIVAHRQCLIRHCEESRRASFQAHWHPWMDFSI